MAIGVAAVDRPRPPLTGDFGRWFSRWFSRRETSNSKLGRVARCVAVHLVVILSRRTPRRPDVQAEAVAVCSPGHTPNRCPISVRRSHQAATDLALGRTYRQAPSARPFHASVQSSSPVASARIGSDTLGTVTDSLLAVAREEAGLSRAELARRSGTSRPTLSAYEHGRVSPTLDTLERVLGAAGHRLEVVRSLRWREVVVGRGRVAHVPDGLSRLPVAEAVGRVELPIHLEWSARDRAVDLSDRRQRLRAYEVVLREGRPVDIERYVDGALLVDAWPDLVLPRQIRVAWQPLIDEARAHG